MIHLNSLGIKAGHVLAKDRRTPSSAPDCSLERISV